MQGGTGLRCRCYDQNVSRSHGMGEGCCMLEMRANDQEWGRFRKKKVRTMEVGMEILKKGMARGGEMQLITACGVLCQGEHPFYPNTHRQGHSLMHGTSQCPISSPIPIHHRPHRLHQPVTPVTAPLQLCLCSVQVLTSTFCAPTDRVEVSAQLP